MTDRPIPFTRLMVLALLAGRKTQTRRIFQPRGFSFYTHPVSGDRYDETNEARGGLIGSGPMYPEALRPYFPRAAGDRLYVREQWASSPAYDGVKPRDMEGNEPICYIADEATRNWAEADGPRIGRYRAGMHMPRWASRLTLTVTEVRVERLQDITEADAIAEGIEREGDGWKSYEVITRGTHKGKPHPHAIVPNKSAVTSYRELWNAINGKNAWDANPWISVTSWGTVGHHNIDQAPPACPPSQSTSISTSPISAAPAAGLSR